MISPSDTLNASIEELEAGVFRLKRLAHWMVDDDSREYQRLASNIAPLLKAIEELSAVLQRRQKSPNKWGR